MNFEKLAFRIQQTNEFLQQNAAKCSKSCKHTSYT